MQIIWDLYIFQVQGLPREGKMHTLMCWGAIKKVYEGTKLFRLLNLDTWFGFFAMKVKVQ